MFLTVTYSIFKVKKKGALDLVKNSPDSRGGALVPFFLPGLPWTAILQPWIALDCIGALD